MTLSTVGDIYDRFSREWDEPFDRSVNKSDVTLAEDDDKIYDTSKSEMCSIGFQFNPQTITSLNISNLSEATNEISRNGRLPDWLLCFQNLKVLDLSKSGLVYVEPGILQLNKLQDLRLQHNNISTWPHFLSKSLSLKDVCLDGNPCLERAFQKSTTLRSEYFSWSITKASVHAVPRFIRGPEWPPARSTRISNTSSIKDFGFYCGGIYTLSTPLESSERGYLTQTTPNIIESQCLNGGPTTSTTKQTDSRQSFGLARQTSRSLFSRQSTRSLNETLASSPLTKLDSHPKGMFSEFGARKLQNQRNSVMKMATEGLEEKRSQIQLEIFDDISFLLKRYEIRRHRAPAHSGVQSVFMVGSSNDSFNQFIPDCDKLSIHGIKECCQVLLDEEIAFVDNLKFVAEKYCQRKLKPFQSQSVFNVVFNSFPAILKIHKDYVLPALNSLVKDLNSLLKNHHKRELQAYPQDPKIIDAVDRMILKANQVLENAFRQMPHTFSKYLGNLCKAEYLLGINGSVMNLYRDTASLEIMQARIARLRNGLIGQLTIAKAKNPMKSQNAFKNTSLYEKDNQSPSVSRIASWFEKKSNNNAWNADTTMAAKYLYLPIVRLIRFERVLASLTRFNRGFIRTASVAHSVRSEAADLIEHTREEERQVLLAQKFSTSLQWMQNYQWDALLWVRSRGYLAQGILEHNTNDVIDADGSPVSFTKEVFAKNKRRALRLICCGDETQLWDEVMEEYIGTIANSGIVAIDPTNQNGVSRLPHLQTINDVRIVFCDVRETCLVEVANFTAKYVGSTNLRQDFIAACNGWRKRTV